MKKIFKLFLCLLMLISYTNVTFALDSEEGEFISVKDVVNNYMNTNFMKGLLKASEEAMKEEDPDAEALENTDFKIVLDEENHKINFTSEGETFLAFDYTDEYVSYSENKPEPGDEIDFGKYLAQMYYTMGMYYSILDTAGYSNYEADIPDDDTIELNEEFYNQYGLMELQEDYAYEEEDGSVEGTYIKEFRVSLSKEKIAALIDKYGTQRSDYETIFTGKVVKPVLTVKKKNATIVVSWKEVINAEKYVVYRSEKKTGKYTKVATLTRDSEGVLKNSYTDKKVKYGKKYYYKVKAIGEKNNETSDIKGLKLIPVKVENVKLGSIKTNSIKISFDKQNETGYVIERSTNGKKWTSVKTITKNSTVSFTNKGLKANTRYYYRVRAYKTVGRSVVYGKYSDVVNVVTAPDKVKFKVVADTYESLKLAVTAVKGATRYEVYRADKKDGKFVKVSDITTNSYKDTGLTLGKTYYYKVRACNKYGKCGTFSSVVGTKVIVKTPKLSLETGNKIPLTVKVSGLSKTKGYEIYRSTSKKGTYKKVKDLSSDITSWIDEGTKKGKTYYYKVRSYVIIDGAKKFSSYTSIKSLTSLYTAPKKEKVTYSSFSGIYTNEKYTVKIFGENEDYIYADFNSEEIGETIIFKLNNESLIPVDGEKNDVITLTKTGIKVTSDKDINGEFTKTGNYTLDEYFKDFYPYANIESKYNGKFESEDGIIYLFQYDDYSIFINETVEEDDLEDLQVDEENYLYGSNKTNNFKVEVNDDVLTLTKYDGETVAYEKTFNKTSSISKEDVFRIFNHLQLK